MKLEFVDSLTLAHPFVKGFDQISYCVTKEEVCAVCQGEISDVISSRKKEDMEGKEGVSPVYSTTFYIGLQIEDRPGKLFFLQYDIVDLFLFFFKLVPLRHDGLTSLIPQPNSLGLLKCGRSSMKLLCGLWCDMSKGWIFFENYTKTRNESSPGPDYPTMCLILANARQSWHKKCEGGFLFGR